MMKYGSISRLARAIGKSPSFMRLILLGKRRPHPNTALKLAAATSTKPELWLYGSVEKMVKAVEAWEKRESEKEEITNRDEAA